MARQIRSTEPWLVFRISFRLQKARKGEPDDLAQLSPPVEVVGHFVKIDSYGHLEIHAKCPQDRVIATFAASSWLSCYPIVPQQEDLSQIGRKLGGAGSFLNPVSRNPENL